MPVRKIANLGKRQLQIKGALSQKQAQEKYFVRLITMHPRYRLIIASLKEGIKTTAIAAHFAKNGWLSVNERTFTEAIRVFRNKHPEALEEVAAEGIDAEVDPNRPHVDLRDQLQQLLRLQRLRIGIDYKHEKDMGKLFKDTVKEIEALAKITETLAKMDGFIQDSGHRGPQEEPGVMDNLNRIKRDQVTRDRLHSAVKQLVEQKA